MKRLLLLFLLSSSSPLLATTRYISTTGNDANSCVASTSTSTPKRNFLGGSGAIACMAAGDTLYMCGGACDGTGSGTFDEELNEVFPTDGDATHVYTFSTYPGEHITIRPTSGNYVIQTDTGMKYLTFRSGTSGERELILDNSGNAGLNVVKSFGDHVTLQDIEITGGGTDGGCILSAEYSGDATDGADFTARRLLVHDCGTDGFDNAIYIQNINGLVENSEIYNVTGACIQFYGPMNGVSGGIARNNYCHSTGTAAVNTSIINVYSTLGTGGVPVQIYNNVVTNGIGTGGGNGGVLLGSGGQARVWNNTFYNLPSGVPCVLNQGAPDTAGPNNVIQNNICWMADTTFVDDKGDATVDHNLTSDPSFVSTSDFHLTRSSTLDTGTAISSGSCPGCQTDKDGISRPQGTGWDIGAYEFVVSTILSHIFRGTVIQ